MIHHFPILQGVSGTWSSTCSCALSLHKPLVPPLGPKYRWQMQYIASISDTCNSRYLLYIVQKIPQNRNLAHCHYPFYFCPHRTGCKFRQSKFNLLILAKFDPNASWIRVHINFCTFFLAPGRAKYRYIQGPVAVFSIYFRSFFELVNLRN